MQKMTIPEFHAALNSQGVAARVAFALICPICGTVQNAQDLIAAGAGASFDEVERFLGFSCVGRWTGAGPAKKGSGQFGCDWTLGGLLSLHELEVIDAEGKAHPRFVPATAEQAAEAWQRHAYASYA